MVWVVSLSTTNVSARSLTPGLATLAFAVWLGLVSGKPLAHPEPYLQRPSSEAAPKGISGRTSYLPVRLEFLLYAQLIR